MEASGSEFSGVGQPLQVRQIPAKKKGCLSARANQRHTTAPLGVFLSGSAKAVAGTT